MWQLKMQELPGPWGGPWTPANIGSLRLPDSASLHWHNLGKNFWAPPPWPNPGSASEGSGYYEHRLQWVSLHHFTRCKWDLYISITQCMLTQAISFENILVWEMFDYPWFIFVLRTSCDVRFTDKVYTYLATLVQLECLVWFVIRRLKDHSASDQTEVK